VVVAQGELLAVVMMEVLALVQYFQQSLLMVVGVVEVELLQVQEGPVLMAQAVVVGLQVQEVEREILLPHLLTEVMERLPIHSKDETEVLDQYLLLLLVGVGVVVQMLQLGQVLMALAQVVEQVEQVLRQQSRVLP